MLLDWAAWAEKHGKERDPLLRKRIPVAELEAVAKAQNVAFRAGDILCIRMGFTAWYNDASQTERKKVAAEGTEFLGIEANEESFRWSRPKPPPTRYTVQQLADDDFKALEQPFCRRRDRQFNLRSMATVNSKPPRILTRNVGIHDWKAVGLGGIGESLCKEEKVDILLGQRATECRFRGNFAGECFGSLLIRALCFSLLYRASSYKLLRQLHNAGAYKLNH